MSQICLVGKLLLQAAQASQNKCSSSSLKRLSRLSSSSSLLHLGTVLHYVTGLPLAARVSQVGKMAARPDVLRLCPRQACSSPRTLRYYESVFRISSTCDPDNRAESKCFWQRSNWDWEKKPAQPQIQGNFYWGFFFSCVVC